MVEFGLSVFQHDGLAGLILILLALDLIVRTLSLVLVFEPYQNWRQKRKFGGWKIEIISLSGERVVWDIGMRKAEAIFDDPREMDIFTKGYASSNGYPKVSMSPNDPRAIEAGMLRIDQDNRTIYLDPAKDPGNQPPKA